MSLFVNRCLVFLSSSICMIFLFYSANISASELSISRTPIVSEPATLRIAASRSVVALGLVEAVAKQFQKHNPKINIHITEQ